MDEVDEEEVKNSFARSKWCDQGVDKMCRIYFNNLITFLSLVYWPFGLYARKRKITFQPALFLAEELKCYW